MGTVLLPYDSGDGAVHDRLEAAQRTRRAGEAADAAAALPLPPVGQPVRECRMASYKAVGQKVNSGSARRSNQPSSAQWAFL